MMTFLSVPTPANEMSENNCDDGSNDEHSGDDTTMTAAGDIVHQCATSAKLDNPAAAASALRATLYATEDGAAPRLEWAVTLLGVFCNQIPDGPAEVVTSATRMAAKCLVEPSFAKGYIDLGTSMLRLIFKLDKPLITVNIYNCLVAETETLNPKAVHYIAENLIHLIAKEARQQRVVLKALGTLVALCYPHCCYHGVLSTSDLRIDISDTFAATLQHSASNGPTRAQCIIGLGCVGVECDDQVAILRSYCDYRTEQSGRVRQCATDALAVLALKAAQEENIPRAIMCAEPVLRVAKFDPEEEIALHAAANVWERIVDPPGMWSALSQIAELFPSLVCTPRILYGEHAKKLAGRFCHLMQSRVADVGLWVLLHGVAKYCPEALSSSLRARVGKALPVLKMQPVSFLWCCRTLTVLQDNSTHMEAVRDSLNNHETLTTDAVRALVQYSATRESRTVLENQLAHAYRTLPSSLETSNARNTLTMLCALLHSIPHADPIIVKDVALMLLILTFQLPHKGLGPNSASLVWAWRRSLPLEHWRCCSECLLDIIRTHSKSIRDLILRAATPQYLFGETASATCSVHRVVALDTLHDLCLLMDYGPLAEVFPHVIRNAAAYSAEEVLCALESLTHLTQEGTTRIASDLLGPLLALIGAPHYGIKQRAFDMVSRLMTTSDHVIVVGSLLQAIFVMNCCTHPQYTEGIRTLDGVPHSQRHHVYKHFMGSMQRKGSAETVTRLLEVVTALLVSPPDDTAGAHGYWCVIEDLLILAGQLGMRPAHPLYATAASLVANYPCDVPSQVWTRLQVRPEGLTVVNPNTQQMKQMLGVKRALVHPPTATVRQAAESRTLNCFDSFLSDT